MRYKFISYVVVKLVLSVVGFLVFFMPILLTISEAATLSVPNTHGKAGETISLPLEIREGKGLAGLKLILVYNKDLLSYKNYKLAPLIQDKQVLINSKEPGRVIFVMAGATSLQKEEGTLVTFEFEIISPPHQDKGSSTFELEKVEMLDEKIKPIPFTVQNGFFQLDKK